MLASITIVLPTGEQDSQRSEIPALQPLRWGVHLTEIKDCDEKIPEK